MYTERIINCTTQFIGNRLGHVSLPEGIIGSDSELDDSTAAVRSKGREISALLSSFEVLCSSFEQLQALLIVREILAIFERFPIY